MVIQHYTDTVLFLFKKACNAEGWVWSRRFDFSYTLKKNNFIRKTSLDSPPNKEHFKNNSSLGNHKHIKNKSTKKNQIAFTFHK